MKPKTQLNTHVGARFEAEHGFTLAETLIALVILAIGMLGVAAMLLDGMRASRIALQRTLAVALVADLGDRIRANRAAGGSYALSSGTALAPPAKTCLVVNQCSTADVATVDLYRWQQAAVAVLPGAQTAVTVAPVGALSQQRYTISISWTQSGDATAADFTLTVQA